MAKKILSPADVDKLAKLSNLLLSDDEKTKMTKQLEETLDYMNNLDELDTKNVETAHSVTNIQNAYFSDGEVNERALSQQNTLKNSKVAKNGYFVVDKII